jgi:hypothetical protein
VKAEPNKAMHANRHPAFWFHQVGFFGCGNGSHRPFPAAVGDLHRLSVIPLMNRLVAIISVLVLCSSCTMMPSPIGQSSGGLPAKEQIDLAAIHRADWTDWRKVLASPAAVHDPFYGKFVEELKHSLVPTEQDAIIRAMQDGGNVDMRTTWQVSALLRLASDIASRPDKDFGQAGDFVWEVRVVNASTFGGITELIWVSTTTGKTRVLHP